MSIPNVVDWQRITTEATEATEKSRTEEMVTVTVGHLVGQSLNRIGSFEYLSGLALLWFYIREVAVRGRACSLFSVPSVPPWFISPLGFTDVCDARTLPPQFAAELPLFGSDSVTTSPAEPDFDDPHPAQPPPHPPSIGCRYRQQRRTTNAPAPATHVNAITVCQSHVGMLHLTHLSGLWPQPIRHSPSAAPFILSEPQ